MPHNFFWGYKEDSLNVIQNIQNLKEDAVGSYTLIFFYRCSN